MFATGPFIKIVGADVSRGGYFCSHVSVTICPACVIVGRPRSAGTSLWEGTTRNARSMGLRKERKRDQTYI